MHIKRVQVQSFKRFTSLTIDNLPPRARLVMMVGQNGCGKSSLFDAFKVWHNINGGPGAGLDEYYHLKYGLPRRDWGQLVQVQFHEDLPQDQLRTRKIFYMRSSYRHQADFNATSVHRMGSEVDAPQVAKMIDTETQLVQDNYQRLVSAAVEDLFSGQHDSSLVQELKEHLVGEIRQSMTRVFGDVVLSGIGHPLQGGSFFFEKGTSREFHYKNLSSGEKGAFDLLLDIIIKRRAYDDTIYCIDEPDLHIHTKLQARLMEEIFNLLPSSCQLWIATHSIGMLRRARDIQETNPDLVVFLDFHDADFDQTVTLGPSPVTRKLWRQTLHVALDDLASLVAPRVVVLCEGRPVGSGRGGRKAEFDAECYRVIFNQECPEVDFLSVGNESEVRSDSLGVGKAIHTLISGAKVIRLVDRDDRSVQEVQDLVRAGVRVLGRRNVESYLLDDEVIAMLCDSVSQPEQKQALLGAKTTSVGKSTARGNPPDDLKSAAGEFYNEAKRILALTQAGSTTEAFLRDTLAPLIKPGMNAYESLKLDIFGD